MRLRPRAPVAGRRNRRVTTPRRVVNLARLAGATLMLACAATIGWLVTSDDFVLDEDSIALSGLGFTDPALVRTTIGLEPGSAPNLFMVRTQQMERALSALPAVASAQVSAVLPHRLSVTISERTAVLIVSRVEGDYLVDVDGVVLDRLSPGRDWVAEVPLVVDRRLRLAIPVVVGQRLDPIDLAAMLRLRALTPATIGSGATALALTVDDADGYVLSALPLAWRAVFGHYTPTLRPPDSIDRQVQCLRSLLAEGEASIDTVYLAPQDDRCGTYLPLATPRTAPSPAPPS